MQLPTEWNTVLGKVALTAAMHSTGGHSVAGWPCCYTFVVKP
jgi:hypothetical protein